MVALCHLTHRRGAPGDTPPRLPCWPPRERRPPAAPGMALRSPQVSPLR